MLGISPRWIVVTDYEQKLAIFLSQEQSEYAKATGQLHDMHRYVHACSPQDLSGDLAELLVRMKDLAPEVIRRIDGYPAFYRQYIDEVNSIEGRLIGLHAIVVAFIVNLNAYGWDVQAEEVDEVIDREVTVRLGFEHAMHNWEELLHRFRLANSQNYHIDHQVLADVLKWKRPICWSAISVVMKVVWKLVEQVDDALENLDRKARSTEHNMELLRLASLLSKQFDSLYAASIDDPDDIFYQTTETEDVALLMNAITYHEPYDKEDHFQRMENLKNLIYFALSAGSKALSKDNLFTQVTSGLVYAAYYKCASTQTNKTHGQFALTIPDERLVQKALALKKRFNIGNREKSVKVKVNKVIYIPIWETDLITVDDLSNPDTPFMLANDVDCDYQTGLHDYDPQAFVKVRIISETDWTAPAVSGDSLTKYPAVIMDIHGGGFINGSSVKQLDYSLPACKYTGCPVFSVDYRLAPDHKFPAGLNDCWQVYLWLVKYAGKYLGLAFDKIVLEADSAGGNLAFGVANLAIQKSTRKPDGLHLVYPAMSCWMDAFSPSMLNAFDSVLLNGSYMKIVLEYYVGKSLEVQKHYLASPKYTPAVILSQFPPWRFLIAGIDPLRDECLRVVLRLLKQNVDVKITEYRHCMHGLMRHAKFPFKFKEPLDATKLSTDYLNELIEN